MWQYSVIVLVWFCLYGKVESFKRTIRSICLFNCLLAEQRRNHCVETKWSCGLHIQLGALYKRVALGRIRCFCLSQAARDVQQIQGTTNSPLRVNGLVSRSQVKAVWLRETTNRLQAADICCMFQEEGLIANRMGIHKFLQKHRETNNIKRRPGSGQPTKMTAAVKAL